MKLEKTVTIDEKYLEAIEYLQARDTVRVILFGIDITNFKSINNSAIKQQVIDMVDILKSMKNEDIARRRK
jgi:wobble nucleotide-excising tRNase